MLSITLTYLSKISLRRHSKNAVNERQTMILEIIKGSGVRIKEFDN